MLTIFLPFLVAGGFEDDGDGAEEDFDIQPRGEILEVEGVVFCLLGGVYRQEIPAVDLRPAGDAGFDLRDAQGFSCLVELDFAGLGGSVADEAHFEGEKAEKLRKLINGGFTDEGTHLGDMFVYLGVLIRGYIMFGIHGHTAEFDAVEGFPAYASGRRTRGRENPA